jgi:hypothetical protein
MPNAIFCRNGHYVGLISQPSSSLTAQPRFARTPIGTSEKQAFCTKCGAESVDACVNCNAPILYRTLGDRAAYCGKCGKPFPWTETALTAAKEYTDELQELNSDEKAILKATFDDLAVDSPRTDLAASRFKTFIRKIGPAAGDVLSKIMVNVATEAAKKGMGI